MSPMIRASLALVLPTATNEIQLLPARNFRTRDGRPDSPDEFVINADVARAVITASQKNGRFVIDYEHQTILAKENGKPAPAAGWFSKMEWRDGQGLFAIDVTWTDPAREMIKRGEYRYISPVIGYDEDTGEISFIHSAALTNDPAVDGMDEVTALKMIDNEKQLNELSAKTQNLARELHEKNLEAQQTQGQLLALKSEMQAARIDEVIEAALNEARILPAHAEAARRLAMHDFEALSRILDRPPLYPALLGMQSSKLRISHQSTASLTNEEMHICALTGRTPDEFAAIKHRFNKATNCNVKNPE